MRGSAMGGLVNETNERVAGANGVVRLEDVRFLLYIGLPADPRQLGSAPKWSQ